MSQQDNVVQRACDQINSDSARLMSSLVVLESYLDKVVTELGTSRNELEGILQEHADMIPDGTANQLWSRLGKFDRCVQQSYARQQSAVDKVIELKSHIAVLITSHNEARDEEAAFAAACVMLAKGVVEEAQKHVE